MNEKIKLFTIGFTKKNAEYFFGELKKRGISTVIDTRLNNVSQLSGFAKKDDLKFFLKNICNINYIHMLDLAPTKDLLDEYKKYKCSWNTYENKFNSLIKERKIENIISKSLVENSCLLCSEHSPHKCHRRLVAEYLRDRWGDIWVDHIK